MRWIYRCCGDKKIKKGVHLWKPFAPGHEWERKGKKCVRGEETQRNAEECRRNAEGTPKERVRAEEMQRNAEGTPEECWRKSRLLEISW